MDQPGHSVHLNQILYILLMIQSFDRNLKLLMAFHLSFAALATPTTAYHLTYRYQSKCAVTCLEIPAFLQNVHRKIRYRMDIQKCSALRPSVEGEANGHPPTR